MTHNNGYNFSQQYQDISQHNQGSYNSTPMAANNLTSNPKQVLKQSMEALQQMPVYHKRSLSPSIVMPPGSMSPHLIYYNNSNAGPSAGNYQSANYTNQQLTQSYNQPFFSSHLGEDFDQVLQINSQSSGIGSNGAFQQRFGPGGGGGGVPHHRGKIGQSVDFNMMGSGGLQSGFQKHLFQDHNTDMAVSKKTPKVQRRDLSPIWGPQQQPNMPQPYQQNPMGYNMMRDPISQLEEYQDDVFGGTGNQDIILTESDVSHQSSFYDIPEERKQKFHQPLTSYPRQREQQKLSYTQQFQNQLQQSQYIDHSSNSAFNSLLKQFQYSQQQQPPFAQTVQFSQTPNQNQYTIPQSQTVKVSPRFNLYKHQQQQIAQKQQQSQLLKSQGSGKYVEQLQNSQNLQKKGKIKELLSKASGNYQRYQEIPVNNKLTSSHNSMGSQSDNNLQYHHFSTDENQQQNQQQKDSLLSQQQQQKDSLIDSSRQSQKQQFKVNLNDSQAAVNQPQNNMKPFDPSLNLAQQNEILVLQRTVEKVSEENIRLQTELEAFKLLSKALLKQNRVVKNALNQELQKKNDKRIYCAKIRELEIENIQLKMRNYKLLDKFHQTIHFIQNLAQDQVADEEINDDYTMIEQLNEENLQLRGLLQIQSDMENLQNVQLALLQEEQHLQEASYDQDLQNNQQLLMKEDLNSDDVKSMIDKASRQIKDQAKKRKEEEKANESMSSSLNLTLDGKPEKFPFKNIKPKKAFLLGSPGGNDDTAASSSDDYADGSVIMSSPEQKQNQ